MATMIQRIRGVAQSRHAKLEKLLSAQDAAIRNRKQLIRDSLPTEASGVLDTEERSLDAEELGVGLSVLELTSRAAQGIETALKRLEAGKLGTCSECQCRISAARLRAQPFAALCLVCQEKHDIAAAVAASQATTGRKERVALTRIEPTGQ
jgi:RNA polymerase-binding transcription factor DksA